MLFSFLRRRLRHGHGKDRVMKEVPEDVRKHVQQEFEDLISEAEQKIADWKERLKDPTVMPQTGELELLVSELDDVRYRLFRLKAE